MKKISLLFTLLLISIIKFHAQEFIWGFNVGNVGFDAAYSMKTDIDGNVYIAGTFLGTVDFDHSALVEELTSAGGVDGFFAKYDSDGNLIWVKQLAGNLADRCTALTIDADGNIIVTGYFSEFLDLDPSAAVYEIESSADDEVFIAKYDSDGNFLWGGQIEGSGNEISTCVEVDNDGNIYVSGTFPLSADFDMGPC